MSSIDHKWLEDFIALARERSFSKAAVLRHVTQPQFSRRIRALELWLGADVVNRSSVPLTLTDAGEQLLPVARHAVTTLSDVRARVQSTRMDGDWLVVATGRTLSRTWVPRWSAQLRRVLGHDVKFRLTTGSINEALVALEQGHADLMLNYAHPRLQVSLDAALYEQMTLAHDELLAVSVPLASGRPKFSLPGKRIAPVPVLRYAPTLALHHIWQDAASRDIREMHTHTVMESDFAESLHEQSLMGAGVAWLPRSLVHHDLKVGRLVLADTVPPVRFEVVLCRPRQARNRLAEMAWKASVQGLPEEPN